MGALLLLGGAGTAGPSGPPDLGPDAGYGMDAPGSSSLALVVDSGTHRGRLPTPGDADWFRALTFPHTTQLTVQVFGVSSCVLVTIVKDPGLSPRVQLSSVLCPGEGNQVRFDRLGPGPGQWGVGVTAGSGPTDYSIHLQVYGGL